MFDAFALQPSLVEWFPLPQFSGWQFHVRGVNPAIGFIVVFSAAIALRRRLSTLAMCFIGCWLIVLGNLAQGGTDAGFVAPIAASGVQYYHDAMRILVPWRTWLATFNENQATLLVHGRTHPPFAVLTFFWMLKAFGGRVRPMAYLLTALSCASLWVVRSALAVLETPVTQATMIVLLFAVVPAVNIYSAVSLDGVVMTTSSLFMLGLLLAVIERRHSVRAYALAVLGFTSTNLLTFGGVFLVGLGCVIALWEWRVRRRLGAATLTAVAVGSFALVVVALKAFGHYDHLEALRTASSLENPQGFAGLADPMGYLQSRIEEVAEVVFFLSLGAAALMYVSRHPRWRAWSEASVPDTFAVAALAVFGGLLITGAFRVGETARVCLFLYPFLVLPLRAAPLRLLTVASCLAAGQTILMQIAGSYFW